MSAFPGSLGVWWLEARGLCACLPALGKPVLRAQTCLTQCRWAVLGKERDYSSCTVGGPWSPSLQRRGFPSEPWHFPWIMGWWPGLKILVSVPCTLPIPNRWVSQAHLPHPSRPSLLSNFPQAQSSPMLGQSSPPNLSLVSWPSQLTCVLMPNFSVQSHASTHMPIDLAGLPAAGTGIQLLHPESWFSTVCPHLSLSS